MTCYFMHLYYSPIRGRRGRHRMVVGFTTTYAIKAYHHQREVYSILHFVIKFIDLRQVGGVLRLHLFPPPTNLTATIKLLKVTLNTIIPSLFSIDLAC